MALTDETGIPATMLVGPQQTGVGGFGGDGWWIILLFLLLLGNGGFAGAGGANGLYPWMNQNDQINAGFRDQALGLSNLQMSNMQTAFTGQTAMSQGFNGLQSQLAQCCCDNRSAIADLKYTIATENCADRAAVTDALRDVLVANTASTQRILDQLCQDKIDAKNEEIANLRTQLNMASLAASQGAQTAALEQYLAPIPRPAYVVQNPYYPASSGTGSTTT